MISCSSAPHRVQRREALADLETQEEGGGAGGGPSGRVPRVQRVEERDEASDAEDAHSHQAHRVHPTRREDVHEPFFSFVVMENEE